MTKPKVIPRLKLDPIFRTKHSTTGNWWVLLIRSHKTFPGFCQANARFLSSKFPQIVQIMRTIRFLMTQEEQVKGTWKNKKYCDNLTQLEIYIIRINELLTFLDLVFQSFGNTLLLLPISVFFWGSLYNKLNQQIFLFNVSDQKDGTNTLSCLKNLKPTLKQLK